MQKADVRRVTPKEARRRVESGHAILVCAYDADEKFQANRLEGAESLSRFLGRLPENPLQREIIFYCA